MDRRAGDAGGFQLFSNSVGAMFGAAKDQCLFPALLFCHGNKRRNFAVFIQGYQTLVNFFYRGVGRRGGKLNRLTGDRLSQLGNGTGKGGRKQHRLALRWQQLQDTFDIVDKAHVQHAVGFI